jgi:raffinose/stachyose/melibiose transport system substrate-binding protein
VAADPAAITDPVSKMMTEGYNTLGARDGLGFYPDWPLPGYYEILLRESQSLLSGQTTPEQFVENLRVPYDEAQQDAN